MALGSFFMKYGRRWSSLKPTELWSGWLERGAKSEAHGQYLKNLRVESLWVGITQVSILVIFLLLWEAAARFQWIDPLIFSYPTKIWKLFIEMSIKGTLFMHTGITVAETLVGFVLGTVLGTLIAIVIWASPFLSRVLDPYIVVLNGMPKVALGPLFIVGLGAGYMAIIFMAVSISVIITTIVVYTSFRDVDTNYIKLARTFGASKSQLFQKIIFPASFPTILSTLKVNVGLAWVGVIVGEFLVSKAGLGYMIIYGFQVFNLTMVMVSLFIISICATVMYQAVSIIEKRMLSKRE
jgi:NitT/TauT family transport system permease protein